MLPPATASRERKERPPNPPTRPTPPLPPTRFPSDSLARQSLYRRPQVGFRGHHRYLQNLIVEGIMSIIYASPEPSYPHTVYKELARAGRPDHQPPPSHHRPSSSCNVQVNPDQLTEQRCGPARAIAATIARSTLISLEAISASTGPQYVRRTCTEDQSTQVFGRPEVGGESARHISNVHLSFLHTASILRSSSPCLSAAHAVLRTTPGP